MITSVTGVVYVKGYVYQGRLALLTRNLSGREISYAMTRIDKIPYKKIIWVLAITETIHNIEEAVWLPKWSQTAGIWHPSVGTFEFRFAVTVIPLFFYWIIYYFSVSKSKLSDYLMGGALVMILINVFMPHMIAAILIRQYAPGVITGIILNIPVTLYLLQRGIKEGVYNSKMLIKSGIAFYLITLPLLQLSFFHRLKAGGRREHGAVM